MTVWVAGPAVGGIMADWGADVIKIEPPSGDPMRAMFQVTSGTMVEHNPPFDLDNRGKKSVVLDLRTEGGREAAMRIVAGADVFVTNMRHEALVRLGFDHRTLTSRFPALVYAIVTGFGLDGPEAARAGYDVGAFWARSGVADTLRVPGEPPPAIRGGFGDHVTGLATLSGVLAALLERQRSGRGRVVETSLLRTGMYCLGWDLGIQLVFDKLRPPMARTEAENPMVNCYEAGDGAWFWLIGVESDRHFPLLCRAVDRDDLLSDERFTSARSRRHNRAALIAILDEVFAGRPRQDWARAFDEGEVWWVPVQTPAEVVADPQALASGAIVDIPGPAGQEAFRAVDAPVCFRDTELRPRRPVPALGEHTEEVLREVGLDEAAIAALRRR
jgi:crotonobetainyl-CoA:carnitine CoA-transferase CaiB-like acyl-CoA transferase